MSDESSKGDWIQRVLGITVGPGDGPGGRRVDPHSIWLEAKEQVDAKLEALGRELRSYGDEDLDQVAEFGLFGLTRGGQTVGLTAALMEYGGAGSTARDGLLKAVAAYRNSLDANEVVDLVDENPFGIDVALRTTLDSALDRIENAVG